MEEKSQVNNKYTSPVSVNTNEQVLCGHNPEKSLKVNYQLNDINDLVSLYCQEAVVLPLLTREGEVGLAKQIEEGHNARKILLSGDFPVWERESVKDSVVGGKQAFEKLVASNYRLVISIAKKHQGKGLSFLDLIQEGNIGLIRAVKRFDYRLGNRFSSYATWWIRQAISRAIDNQGRTIRIPAYLIQEIYKIKIARNQLQQSTGQEPSFEDISDYIGSPSDQIEETMRYSLNPFSLDKPVYDEEDSVFGDFIEDKRALIPEEVESTEFLRGKIDQLLTQLPARDRKILEMRFGINGHERHTLNEIGAKFRLTRERIRQLEKRSLNQLRTSHLLNQIRDYLEVG
ncbi:MAG: sigma-70 family RNA polymerase sigma factor [Anaerolineales bacterium]|jgi:RNA polymerase primary sigma factor